MHQSIDEDIMFVVVAAIIIRVCCIESASGTTS